MAKAKRQSSLSNVKKGVKRKIIKSVQEKKKILLVIFSSMSLLLTLRTKGTPKTFKEMMMRTDKA